jgi:hypothetical protein
MEVYKMGGIHRIWIKRFLCGLVAVIEFLHVPIVLFGVLLNHLI